MWGRGLARWGVGLVLSRSIALAVLIVSSLVFVPTGQAVPLTPPSPPQDVQVASTADGVEVTWEAPLFDGGSDSITYRVYRNSALLADGLATTSFLDTSIGGASASATTYSYTVTAMNEKGESAHSGGLCLSNEMPPQVSPSNCVGFVLDLTFWAIGVVTNNTGNP